MTQQDRTAVQYHKMTETPIPRLILSLAAPTILSMLITSIYNLADTFFVGRISTSASGAVGVVSSLMAIIQALGFMLGHGSGTIISRRLGSQDTHAATRFASTSFFTALAFGVVLAVVGLATLPDFMMLLGSTETILPHACAYARPILLAAPLMISSLVMNNILRYEGKANLAMIGLVTGGLLNIALDPLFMFGLGLSTAGAGIATALSQTISFGILLYMFLQGKTVSQFRLSAVTREPREFFADPCRRRAQLWPSGAEQHRRDAAEHCRPQLRRCRRGGHEHRVPHFYVHPLGGHRRGTGLAAGGVLQLRCPQVPPGAAGRRLYPESRLCASGGADRGVLVER